MEIKTEIITRALISLFIVFVLGRIVASTLKSFLDGLFKGKKKQSHLNFDHLISSKINELSSRSKKNNHKVENKDKKEKSKTKYIYEKALSSSEDQDIEKILKLFDYLKWGSGEELTKLKIKLENKYGLHIELNEVVTALRTIINDDTIIKIKSPRLPDYEEVISILESKIFTKKIFETIKKKSDKDQEKLSKYFQSEKTTLSQSITHYFFIKNKMKGNIIEKVALNKISMKNIGQKEIDNLTDKLIMSYKNNQFITISEITEEIITYNEIYTVIKPLKEIRQQNEQEDALKVFNLENKMDKDIVKKRYKELVSKRHPDKISNYKLSEKIINTINNNFNIIQNAYEILKKD